jgi:hypothetical protein
MSNSAWWTLFEQNKHAPRVSSAPLSHSVLKKNVMHINN